MTLFNVKKEKLSLTTYFPILLLALVLFAFILFSDTFRDSNLKQERDILQKALDRNITQCYALEGSYPSSLHYLEENYGLTYNKEHFFIDYQYIGGNLRPDVTILERD